MEDARRQAYSRAFIAQARSDFQVYRHLTQSPEFAVCHSLHYLQMSTEKLAKAYRLRDLQSPVDELISRHVGFSKFIVPFCIAALKDEYRGRDQQLNGLISRARKLAREIEKLAPAVDRTVAPENTEYPWESHGRVVAPCAYEFPNLELRRQPGGVAFLKLIERALASFEDLCLET